MSENKQEEPEYPYWNRVYISVIIYTVFLIAGLYALSQMFR